MSLFGSYSASNPFSLANSSNPFSLSESSSSSIPTANYDPNLVSVLGKRSRAEAKGPKVEKTKSKSSGSKSSESNDNQMDVDNDDHVTSTTLEKKTKNVYVAFIHDEGAVEICGAFKNEHKAFIAILDTLIYSGYIKYCHGEKNPSNETDFRTMLHEKVKSKSSLEDVCFEFAKNYTSSWYWGIDKVPIE